MENFNNKVLIWFFHSLTCIFAIFTFFTFAILSTDHSCLIALTIFFLTTWFFTVASFSMLLCFELWFKCFRVSLHKINNCITSFLLKIISVMTIKAITLGSTSPAFSKTITVKFKTLGPLAIANQSFFLLPFQSFLSFLLIFVKGFKFNFFGLRLFLNYP